MGFELDPEGIAAANRSALHPLEDDYDHLGRQLERVTGFDPAYMLDQSHNVTDPIESLMTSAVELVRAYLQAHLVDQAALDEAQQRNDALLALQTLKQAFTTDVAPVLAMARMRAGGAIDPLGSLQVERLPAAGR